MRQKLRITFSNNMTCRHLIHFRNLFVCVVAAAVVIDILSITQPILAQEADEPKSQLLISEIKNDELRTQLQEIVKKSQEKGITCETMLEVISKLKVDSKQVELGLIYLAFAKDSPNSRCVREAALESLTQVPSERAIQALVENITTLERGKNLGLTVDGFYPCVRALMDIGSRARPAILSSLTSPRSKLELSLMAKVLVSMDSGTLYEQGKERKSLTVMRLEGELAEFRNIKRFSAAKEFMEELKFEENVLHIINLLLKP